MKIDRSKKTIVKTDFPKAQSSLEYMLLLAVVTGIVLVGFQVFLPRGQRASDIYFNRAAIGIMGDALPGRFCGDTNCLGLENCHNCKADCGAPFPNGICPPPP